MLVAIALANRIARIALGFDGQGWGLSAPDRGRVTTEADRAVSGCGGVNEGLWANGHEDGVGKTSWPDGAIARG
jgi:hypothetical protein